MASAQLFFYLTCLLLEEMAQMNNFNLYTSIHQERRFLSGKTGDSVTLRCFYEGDAVMLYWYKQTLGQEPRLISTSYKHDIDGTFHNEFQSNPRFTLVTVKGKNDLKITELHISDSATYYCASSYLYTLDFADGTTINVNHSGLNFQTLVQQSTSQTIQPGDAVTLNCTVHTGNWDGEQSVYWFRTEEESYPGLIYTRGGKKDICEQEPNSQTHTCVYNLPLRSLSVSDVGTDYCAVASCGHILFGNGTKLDFEDEEDCLVLVYALSGAVVFTTILSVLLWIENTNTSLCTECHETFSDPFTKKVEGYQTEDPVCYTALTENPINTSRGQRDETLSECVYFSVRQ